MNDPAVEKTEAKLAEIKALLDELLDCTAECVRLGNPLANESTAEIKDRWRRETAEQAPACLSGVRAVTVHVSANLTAEDAGVLGTAHQVLDGMPLPDMTTGTEEEGGAIYLQADETLAGKDFEVFTTVGALSLFLERGLDFADQMFDGITLKDVVLAEEMPDNVLTHVGGISLFFELDLRYDTDVRHGLPLLLGSNHALFVDGTYDVTPLEWPLQEHNKMWQLFGEIPPWGRNRFSLGQDGINSTYHVFGKWSPWICSAVGPKSEQPHLGGMPPWRQRAFSPWKSGIRDAHCVIDKAPPWNKKDIHHGNFATRGDPLLLNKIPSWQRSAFSPWLGNFMRLILGQQEGTEGCQIDLLLLNNGEQDFGPTSSFSVQASPFVFAIEKWKQRHSEHSRCIKKFENLVLRAMGIFQSEQCTSLALIYCCQMSLVLNCTSSKPEVKVHTSVAFGLGTNADVQITKEPTYFPSQAGNSLLLTTAYHCWHLESRSLEKFDIIWLLQVHTELYRHCDLFFMIQLASKLQFKQWDPGVLRICVAQMRNPRTAGTKDACDWTSWSRRRYPCRSWRYCLLRPVQAIAWGQAMFRGGGNVIPAHGDIPGEVDMGRGPAGVGSWHGSLAI